MTILLKNWTKITLSIEHMLGVNYRRAVKKTPTQPLKNLKEKLLLYLRNTRILFITLA